MPLVIAPMNVDLIIKKVIVDTKVKKHLESLGLTMNSTIRIMENTKGNLIVKVKNVRFAVDKEIAGKIFVA